MKSPSTLKPGFNEFTPRIDSPAPASRGVLESMMADAGIQLNPINGAPWDIQVKDQRQFTARLTSPLKNGLTELGDMYVEGIWECEDIAEFFRRCLNSGLGARFTHTLPNLFQYGSARLFNLQTRSRAAGDVSGHYDLGPVFEVMLDPLMTYTCGYWKDGIKTLDEAQRAKHELGCRKLGLEPGMDVLDIGCGWGAFLKYAATHHGIHHGLGVTLSKEQVALGSQRCEGLPVSLVVRDYRDVQGSFDRIGSFGMFEHVGPKNYRTYFEKVHEVLKPGGLFLLHTFGNTNPSPTILTPEVEWVNHHIFPGLVCPSFGQIADASDGLLTLLDVQEFGAYYDPTLVAWHANFVAGWPSIQHHYDERFYRKWCYYLLMCAGSFRSGRYHLWQTVFGKDHPGAYQAAR